MSRLTTLSRFLGVAEAPASHAEKLVSAAGGFVAIFGILLVSQWSVGAHAAAIVVASMGASAVLLFAVPHGPLSQPWPVFGGHLISAVIGVTCARFIPAELLAASVAVGLAIGVMYYLRCIHPPGGATALSAVVGGDAVHDLGYQFVLTPVLLNIGLILLVGVLFNAFFPWRRYPAFWYERTMRKTAAADQGPPGIAHEDFVYALSRIDSFIDISEQDLLRIYDLAMQQSRGASLPPESLVVGGYYSNGEYGLDWAVRQIVDAGENGKSGDDLIIYKVVAGNGRRSSGYSSRDEFLRWAKHRVIRDEENWKRVGG